MLPPASLSSLKGIEAACSSSPLCLVVSHAVCNGLVAAFPPSAAGASCSFPNRTGLESYIATTGRSLQPLGTLVLSLTYNVSAGQTSLATAFPMPPSPHTLATSFQPLPPAATPSGVRVLQGLLSFSWHGSGVATVKITKDPARARPSCAAVRACTPGHCSHAAAAACHLLCCWLRLACLIMLRYASLALSCRSRSTPFSSWNASDMPRPCRRSVQSTSACDAWAGHCFHCHGECHT